MNKTPITLTITSRQIAVSAGALDRARADLGAQGVELSASTPENEEDNTFTMSSEGTLSVDRGQVIVEYAETELTGMQGATTCLRFDRDNPGLVTMLREGTVETVLVFERGKQHICAYRTPYMPFELCVRTYRVINELLETGFLYLDYTIEVRGARVERNKFTLEISAEDGHLADILAHEMLPELPTDGEADA